MLSLQELTRAVYACRQCNLHKEGRPVIGSGPLTARILLLGEAPGESEVQASKPFVGPAGRFLDNSLLPAAGLDRKEVRVSNTVLHRPPGNRDPWPEEVEACRPWLELQLELVEPEVVVLLGKYAIEAVLGIEKPLMKNLHGRFVRKAGRLFFLSLHPAAALHQPSNRQLIIEDFEKLKLVLTAHKEAKVANDYQV